MNFKDILLGAFFIGIGVWIIYFTYKNPDSQLLSSNFKGYLGGIMSIVIGFLILMERFTL